MVYGWLAGHKEFHATSGEKEGQKVGYEKQREDQKKINNQLRKGAYLRLNNIDANY